MLFHPFIPDFSNLCWTGLKRTSQLIKQLHLGCLKVILDITGFMSNKCKVINSKNVNLTFQDILPHSLHCSDAISLHAVPQPQNYLGPEACQGMMMHQAHNSCQAKSSNLNPKICTLAHKIKITTPNLQVILNKSFQSR